VLKFVPMVMEEYKRIPTVKVEAPSYDSCLAALLRPYDPGEIPVVGAEVCWGQSFGQMWNARGC
jgi:hypothetical protein